MRKTATACVALAAVLMAAPAVAQDVKFVGIFEMSGPGTTAGTNFKNGADLAIKEINEKGGILGRKIAITSSDTASNPTTAKALAQKAVDEQPYILLGPVFSGSVLSSMIVAQEAGLPQWIGGEAANITQQGNPFVFRTSFSQAQSMPKIANYIAGDLKAKSIAVAWVNNDFGKGGRDQIAKEMGSRNVKVVADLSTEPGQVDFSAVVTRAKQSNPDVLFVYLNEEESARLLRELKKQGWDMKKNPVVGETTLIGQKVIELAGDAANGAQAHVGLTIDAPNPLLTAFAAKYEAAYKAKSDHNGIKGYTGVYVIKAVTEKLGKFDRKAFAEAMKTAQVSAKDNPGVLMSVCFNKDGDLDRDSYLAVVKDGKQVIEKTLPPVGICKVP